jgi:hypothetical protein
MKAGREWKGMCEGKGKGTSEEEIDVKDEGGIYTGGDGVLCSEGGGEDNGIVGFGGG